MTRGLDDAVELLDRSLAYTRVALASVTDRDLGSSTPCAGWDLDRLLTHLEDSLDAFTEGAGGTVSLASRAPAVVGVDRLQQKACALLGAWTCTAAPRVRVGDHLVDTEVVVLAATLEIAVHGWDVARSTGLDHALPPALAARLAPLARRLVVPADRGVRFGPAVPLGAPAAAAADLLGFLGRDLTGPPGQESDVRGTGPRRAS